MKPTRKIGLSYWSLTGKVGSTKNSRMHDFESSLERDLLITLEFDGFIESYCEQPVCIEYLHDGTTRRYTPDVIVYYRKDVEAVKHLKPMLCEVKYRADLKKHWQELKPKYMAALRYASQQGWRFKILTEKEIRTEYQWNAKFLTNYRKPMVGEIDTGDFTLLLQTVEQLYHTTPKQVMMSAVRDEWKRAELIYVLWYMIANGFVKCDLSRKLTMDTEIWLH